MSEAAKGRGKRGLGLDQPCPWHSRELSEIGPLDSFRGFVLTPKAGGSQSYFNLSSEEACDLVLQSQAAEAPDG